VPAANGLAEAYQLGCTTSGFWYTNGADWYITAGDTKRLVIRSMVRPGYDAGGHRRQDPCGVPDPRVHGGTSPGRDQLHAQDVPGGLRSDDRCAIRRAVGRDRARDGHLRRSGAGPHVYQEVLTDPIAGISIRPPARHLYRGVHGARYQTVAVAGAVVAADATTTVNCALTGLSGSRRPPWP